MASVSMHGRWLQVETPVNTEITTRPATLTIRVVGVLPQSTIQHLNCWCFLTATTGRTCPWYVVERQHKENRSGAGVALPKHRGVTHNRRFDGLLWSHSRRILDPGERCVNRAKGASSCFEDYGQKETISQTVARRELKTNALR